MQYEASFPEDVPINTAILTVGATDLDSGVNAEIQYSLFGIGVEDFYMDANTGISVQTPFDICLYTFDAFNFSFS